MSNSAAPPSDDWLDAECRRLLDFGRDVAHPVGGAAWLDDDGRPDLSRPVHTWITSRTVHVYALGHLLGVEGCTPVATAALDGLRSTLHDAEHGGWFSAVDGTGSPTGTAKSCYDHAFVMLAASSAVAAGLPGADALLADATDVFERHFWDEPVGRVVDEWDRSFSEPMPYRGLNSSMHSVEAMLAVGDVTGDSRWHERAGRIAAYVVELARTHDGRLPEHFGPDWSVDLELNRDRPDDPFKPFGATIGHGLEWARLLLHVEATLGEAAPAGLAGHRPPPLRPGGGRRLGRGRRTRLRLHDRLGRHARRAPPDALGRCGGDLGCRGAPPAYGRGGATPSATRSGGPTPSSTCATSSAGRGTTSSTPPTGRSRRSGRASPTSTTRCRRRCCLDCR